MTNPFQAAVGVRYARVAELSAEVDWYRELDDLLTPYLADEMTLGDALLLLPAADAERASELLDLVQCPCDDCSSEPTGGAA